ncbi:MAG: hypothetical protein JJT96_05035 [Opitutales bacterium]|nr:hypothetical protein [Opitutales bacterium]
MKANTMLLLYNLLWTVDTFARPSYRMLDESFEGWAHRRGLLGQIHRLEAEGFLESQETAFDRKRIVRLTEAGRRAALGGRDPEACWSTPWDKKWRLVLFDLPADEHRLRKQLHRSLKANGCGCLQGSVWISARPVPDTKRLFENPGRDCSHLILLDAVSRGAKVDRQMVNAAYRWDRINENYEDHLQVLRDKPPFSEGHAAFLAWSRRENNAWLTAVSEDPLLPAELLPRGYLGRKAWNKRKRVLKGMETRSRSLLSNPVPSPPREA